MCQAGCQLECPVLEASEGEEGSAELPCTAQLEGTDKKGFELWTQRAAANLCLCELEVPLCHKGAGGFGPSAGALCQHGVLPLLFLSTVATNKEISFIYFNLLRSKLFPGLCLFLSSPTPVPTSLAAWGMGFRLQVLDVLPQNSLIGKTR